MLQEAAVEKQLMAQIEGHRNQMANLQTAQGDSESVLDALLKEFEPLLATEDDSAIQEVQPQVKTMLTTLEGVSPVVKVVEFILRNGALANPSLIDAAADALCSHNLHECETDTFGLVVQLYDASSPDSSTRESIAIGLRNAAKNAATFHELEHVAAVAIAASDLPQVRKEALEEVVVSRLVPLIGRAEHQNRAVDLLHRLCFQMTHAGGVFLQAQLMELLNEADLSFASYRFIADVVCTHELLQGDLPAACAAKIAWFATIPEMTDEALGLIPEIWNSAPETFRIQLASEMQTVVDAENFAYTPDRYALLLGLIEYLHHVTADQIPDREDVQLHYVKAILRFSQTSELVEDLYNLVRKEGGIFSEVLLPRSRVALSVWLLLAPLAVRLPYSKLKANVDGWRLPPAAKQPVTLRQITTVFEYLLTEETTPNQYAQIRRAFINALGQLVDSEGETTIEMGESLFAEFARFIAGVSDRERRTWEQVCKQIWEEDSRRGAPDVDQIRSGQVRRLLKRRIKQIFSN
jgi:hypothetical protein